MSTHITGVFHPTRYDGHTARCSCGWSSEEMADAHGAELVGIDHMIEYPEPDAHGNAVVDFDDGTLAIHTARGWYLVEGVSAP